MESNFFVAKKSTFQSVDFAKKRGRGYGTIFEQLIGVDVLTGDVKKSMKKQKGLKEQDLFLLHLMQELLSL